MNTPPKPATCRSVAAESPATARASRSATIQRNSSVFPERGRGREGWVIGSRRDDRGMGRVVAVRENEERPDLHPIPTLGRLLESWALDSVVVAEAPEVEFTARADGRFEGFNRLVASNAGDGRPRNGSHNGPDDVILGGGATRRADDDFGDRRLPVLPCAQDSALPRRQHPDQNPIKTRSRPGRRLSKSVARTARYVPRTSQERSEMTIDVWPRYDECGRSAPTPGRATSVASVRASRALMRTSQAELHRTGAENGSRRLSKRTADPMRLSV